MSGVMSSPRTSRSAHWRPLSATNSSRGPVKAPHPTRGGTQVELINSHSKFVHKPVMIRRPGDIPKPSQCASKEKGPTLRSNRRNLKLLGLNPAEFGLLEEEVEPPPKFIPPLGCPTMVTRLTKRTVSLEDLRVTNGELPERKTLAEAVYQEWYFQKMEKKKEKDRQEEQKRREEEERKKVVEAEMRRKQDAAFEEWVNQKKKKYAVVETEKDKVDKKEEERRKKEKQEKAFKAWKKVKDKEIAQRFNKLVVAEEEVFKKKLEEEKEKEEVAKIAFKSWKEKADQERARKKLEAEEKKRRQEEEEKDRQEARKKDAAAGYEAWKEKKDSELAKELKKKKLLKLKVQLDAATKKERAEENNEAYEAWLLDVDTRKKQYEEWPLHRELYPWMPR